MYVASKQISQVISDLRHVSGVLFAESGKLELQPYLVPVHRDADSHGASRQEAQRGLDRLRDNVVVPDWRPCRIVRRGEVHGRHAGL